VAQDWRGIRRLWRGRLGKVVAECVGDRVSTPAGADLSVNAGHVALGGSGTEHKPFGNLPVAFADSEEAKHIELTNRQAITRAGRSAMQ
jgi:hypothetical protein